MLGCIDIGMCAIIPLIDHPFAESTGNRSVEGCTEADSPTKMLQGIKGIIGMVDGKNLIMLQPSDFHDFRSP